ncbi:MAG: hypothetical protein HN411_06075 [Waddliaceae bacterium]|jgi:lipoate---protein ligase|nr:hypothetical protein [Waddliaceae bacterium]MBT4444691.1 hypothetical protein [Waddliaceae bacterium]MBT6928710.1 hypothetical protein [Waddliaceae bacterium]MBT7264942.1 hypothetical protein [Waddliaceae bacterium]MBT7461851.1 hypothetical protein [Waddliaceae bacterium]
MWEIIDTGSGSAEENMRYDKELLDALGERDKSVLHLYEWATPSYTYGYFCKPKDLLDLDAAKRHGLSGAQRSTGGGIILHTHDMAFSVLVPRSSEFFSENTLENYRFVNNIVIEVLKPLVDDKISLACDAPSPPPTFCMAAPTQYDVIDSNGKKVAGAAQRTTKHGFLHQGTISIAMPDNDILIDLIGDDAAENMQKATYVMAAPLEKARKHIRQRLTEVVERQL